MTPLDVFTCPLDGKNLIEASAGTGKTWNICGLYLRLLLERQMEVRHILVVTFTKAATAELRDRIRQRLVETLSELRGEGGASGDPFVSELLRSLRAKKLSDEAMTAHLELALACFDEAAIFTIHSFCQRALADTPFTAQMPLNMELVEDDELCLQAVNDFWRWHIAADTADPLLANYLLERTDSPEKYAELLKRHLAKPLAMIQWPLGIDSPCQLDICAFASAHAGASEVWNDRRDSAIKTVLDALPSLNAQSYKTGSVSAAASEWDGLLRFSNAIQTVTINIDKAKLFDQQNIIKKTKKDHTPPVHDFFAIAHTWLTERENLLAGLRMARLRLLKTMLTEAGQTLRDNKRQRRVVAYDDMLYNLYQRLTCGEAPWLAEALPARFPAALIDEFQDTDPQQFAIFQAIYASGDKPLFLVGDPKQAIYGFRNADLQTYLQARSHTSRQFTLVDNQRSDEFLIEALNALFSTNPQVFLLDGLEYRPVKYGQKPRKQFRDDSQPQPAPLQIWTLPGKDAEGDLLSKHDARQQVVRSTATEIVRLLDEANRGQIILDGKPLRAGDIAVLVRTHAEGSLIREALRKRGVDSVELSQNSVFASQDAEELDRLLSAIVEPGRSPWVKAALATELMGCEALSIYELTEDEGAFAAITQRLAGYRQTWLDHGIGHMFRQWVQEEQVAERLLQRQDGERRLTNLLHLSECLQQAAEQHFAPDTLLQWFRLQRREGSQDESRQLRLESDRNLVQIVTIHRSKGLEYPIVFCPFLWTGRLPNFSSGLDGVEYHADNGLATIDFRQAGDADYHENDVKARGKLEKSAEFLRLIYVALTRAVHRCVLVAGCYQSNPGGRSSSKESRRSLLNWMVAGRDQSAQDWFDADNPPEVASVYAAWDTLAVNCGHQKIAVLSLPAATDAPLKPRNGLVETLSALAPPQRIPSGWWLGSFSGLAHGARQEQAALDHDVRIDQSPMTLPASDKLAADDILNFPRGAQAGDCMHALFERIDFTQPDSWQKVIDSLVRQWSKRQSKIDAAGENLYSRMLANMLTDVLNTPLSIGTPKPLKLADLPMARRLTELEFHLPASDFHAGTLNEWLALNGYAMPRLSFTTLKGFLKGFIDLVFEHDGRYFILDWKSNHLGYSTADYDAAGLAAKMSAERYHLQYLFYSVALDHYLNHRLADYDPDRHFGGVVYLFVRGVRPGWTTADGSPAGVYFHRPPPPLITQLSALLDGKEVNHV